MLKQKITLLGLAAVLAFTQLQAAGWAEETSPPAASLNFKEAYQKILAYYPRLKSQKARAEEAVAEKFEAYAALFPKVEGLSSVTTGDDPVYVFGSHLRQEKFADGNFALSSLNSPRHRTNFSFALQGEMPLFNAFQTISRIRSARFLSKAEARWETLTAMEASLLSVEGYLKGLLARDNLRRVREVEDAAQKDLRQADELKDKGMVLGADFYAAKMVLAEIRQMNISLAAGEKTSRILLNILMGAPAEWNYSLSGDIPENSGESGPLQDWLRAAHETRPDLAALELKAEALRVEVFREKMSALPRVGAFGTVSEDSHDLRTGGENFIMGVKSTVNVLDAGYWARRKKARAAYKAILEDVQALKDQVSKDIAQAVNGLEAVTANIPVAEEGYQAAGEAVKQTEVLYREGKKSIADLLEIRRAFLSAAFKRNELLFQQEMARANLLFLSGRLDEKALDEIDLRIGGEA